MSPRERPTVVPSEGSGLAGARPGLSRDLSTMAAPPAAPRAQVSPGHRGGVSGRDLHPRITRFRALRVPTPFPIDLDLGPAEEAARRTVLDRAARGFFSAEEKWTTNRHACRRLADAVHARGATFGAPLAEGRRLVRLLVPEARPDVLRGLVAGVPGAVVAVERLAASAGPKFRMTVETFLKIEFTQPAGLFRRRP